MPIKISRHPYKIVVPILILQYFVLPHWHEGRSCFLIHLPCHFEKVVVIHALKFGVHSFSIMLAHSLLRFESFPCMEMKAKKLKKCQET